MGAQWTVTATSPDASFPYGGFISPVPNSKHVMGTTRMGANPATSVVNPFGRLHDVPNVVVADSSVFVTSSGYGPTLTLVALALRAARALMA
jgi:gluconate 2-dehydrogenase alpha chain